MTGSSIFGTSAGNPSGRRGRPLSAQTIRVREAILALADTYDRMTVRGIFYALLGVVPKDENQGYRVVQRQALALRQLGLLPWGFVADGTRWVRRVTTYDDADDALEQVARFYRRDLWRTQGWRVEIWLEKDALADLIAPTTERWGVPLSVSRGVPSATYVHSAAMDARRAAPEHRTKLFALYDYDAGGERAFRTVRSYFDQYAPGVADVVRLALNADQVARWDLPTRPPKNKDPEAAKWGDKGAVELDAVLPDALTSLVDDAIRGLVDQHAWEIEKTAENEELAGLRALVGRNGKP